MNVNDQIRMLAMIRVAVGGAAVLAPRLGGLWVGTELASQRPGKMLMRAFGVREIAIGLGTLLATDRGTPVRGWVEAGALCDAGDVVATLLAFRHVPRGARVLVPLSAGSAAYAGMRLAREMSSAT